MVVRMIFIISAFLCVGSLGYIEICLSPSMTLSYKKHKLVTSLNDCILPHWMIATFSPEHVLLSGGSQSWSKSSRWWQGSNISLPLSLSLSLAQRGQTLNWVFLPSDPHISLSLSLCINKVVISCGLAMCSALCSPALIYDDIQGYNL